MTYDEIQPGDILIPPGWISREVYTVVGKKGAAGCKGGSNITFTFILSYPDGSSATMVYPVPSSSCHTDIAWLGFVIREGRNVLVGTP